LIGYIALISEKISCFRNNSDGKPIEFPGADFELLRDEWKSKRKVKMLGLGMNK
jgi:hypothetical protein